MPVVRSKLSPVSIPEGVTLHQYLKNRANQHGEKIALIDGVTGRSYTYRKIWELVDRVAGALYHEQGVRKGDVVCCCMYNCVEYVFFTYAVLSIGGIITTSNPTYRPGEIRTQLLDAGARFILTMPEQSQLVQQATQGVPIKARFVIGRAPGYVPWDFLINYRGQHAPTVLIDPRIDPAFLPYSSGTTGKQKGVVLTHYNMVATTCQQGHPALEMGNPNDVTVWTLPFYHIYGISTVFCYTPNIGGTTVVLPRFHLEAYLSAAQKYRASLLFIVPPIALQLARSPLVGKYDLSKVRAMWCGAAPLGRDLERELANRFKNVPVKQGYGMTEASPLILPPPVEGWKTGSAGTLAPNTVAKIIDVETGDSLGVGRQGELCIQGPQVMRGYHRNTLATKQTIDNNGWLHTGDIAYYDKELNFFVVDRLKELIKYKGFQVAPAELESLLLTHACVSDVAVIGRPDYEAGELPMAFVVTKPNIHVTKEEIKSFVNGKVARHKWLRGGVEFVKEIPKSAAGKILRRALRDRVKAEHKAKL